MVKEKKLSMFFLKILPVIILWVIIVGGQYDIGADYFSYYYYFNNPDLANRYEPFFHSLSQIMKEIGFAAQIPFFIYALLNAVIVFIIGYRLKITNWGLFYFLLITVSTFFNNQMNGIRQCIAIPIACWGIVELYQSKWKGVLLIILAGGFHYSAFVCLLFYPIKYIVDIVTKYPRLLLLFTIVLSAIPSTDTLNSTIINYLPDFIRYETVYEQAYSNNYKFAASTDFIYKLSKLMLVPVYFIALKLLTQGKLTKIESNFFKLGLMSYSLRCVLLINNLIGRFSGFFWIFSILPIYYLASEYWKQQKYVKLILLLIYCSAIYFIKVIAGTAEYKSSFIYFQ